MDRWTINSWRFPTHFQVSISGTNPIFGNPFSFLDQIKLNHDKIHIFLDSVRLNILLNSMWSQIKTYEIHQFLIGDMKSINFWLVNVHPSFFGVTGPTGVTGPGLSSGLGAAERRVPEAGPATSGHSHRHSHRGASVGWEETWGTSMNDECIWLYIYNIYI